ncbi:MAG: HAMP domain-containing histidine kinase [Myxococcales bacterium]|nr:HAMP domain-containing histidine kinase [Myxococcales bacterium]
MSKPASSVAATAVQALASVDDPIAAGSLLGPEEQGLLQSVCELGCELAVLDSQRRCLFGSAELAHSERPSGTGWVQRDVFYAGERIATLIAAPHSSTVTVRGSSDDRPAGLRIAHFAVRLGESLLYSAIRRTLTSRAHEAYVEETHCELQQKAQRLEQAMERMRDADRIKASFLATVSHELRTPLTSVLGYSEMLLDGLAGPLNEEQRDYLSTVMAKGEQLLALISKLLDVSRIETVGVQLNRRPVDLRDLIHEVVYLQAPQARRRRLHVLVDLPTQLPWIQADREKLRQVLSNLISNAIKFTPEHGDVRIEIKTLPSAELATAQAVQVSVIDSGIGIPPELHDKVFDTFYQVDNSPSRAYEGSGLGLAIVRRFVEAHGGQVWVESGRERGAIFRFTLPLPPTSAEFARGNDRA